MSTEEQFALELQTSLRAFFFVSEEGATVASTKHILVGKLLSSRLFRRYTVFEIITKAWRTRDKVEVEKLGDDIFKFFFTSQVDKSIVFEKRLWSFKGALLILKEWQANITWKEISFDFTDFTFKYMGYHLI